MLSIQIAAPSQAATGRACLRSWRHEMRLQPWLHRPQLYISRFLLQAPSNTARSSHNQAAASASARNLPAELAPRDAPIPQPVVVVEDAVDDRLRIPARGRRLMEEQGS